MAVAPAPAPPPGPTVAQLGVIVVKELRANGSPHNDALANWIEALDKASPAKQAEFVPPKMATTKPVKV
jgi:hypothetical protein